MIKSDTIYVDRGGRQVGPLKVSTKRPNFPWYVRLDEKRVRTFTVDGRYHTDGTESEFDLMHEWIEPAVEKEIVAIDQATPEHLRRGVARIWDSYKLLP